MDERTGEIRDTLTSKGTSSSLDFYNMSRSLFRIIRECLILETLSCSSASALLQIIFPQISRLHYTALLYLCYPALGLQLTKSTLLFPGWCVLAVRWVFSVNFVELTLEVISH